MTEAKPPPSEAPATPNTEQRQHGAFRRRATGTVSTGYSRAVNVMKVALPLLALGIMGTVVAWPTFVEQRSRKLVVEASSSDLLNPRYFSVDEQGQPFSVVAKLARESSTDAGIVNLDQPEAEMREKEGTWVTMRSLTGDYNRNSRILHMVGNVHIIRDDGTEYTTDDAYADIAKGIAWGDGRIVGQGPQGEVDAQGFRLTDRGRTITFVNQTKANLPTFGGGKKEHPAPAPNSAPAPSSMPVVTAVPPHQPAPQQPIPQQPTPAAKPPAPPPAPTVFISPPAIAAITPAPAPPQNRVSTVTPARPPTPAPPPSAAAPPLTAKPVWQPPRPQRKPAAPKSRN